MSSSILRSEVSEVIRAQILRTESGWRACARTMYIVMYTPMYRGMYMGVYNVHDVRAVEGRNDREIDCKAFSSKHLNAFSASLAPSTNNLATEGHNLAFLRHNLAITSPTKPMKTLMFSQKARLARLEVDISRVGEMYVHPHVHVHSPYRRELEITSLYLANLASGFSGVRAPVSLAPIHRTTLPHVARSLRSCPTSRLSRMARVPVWHPQLRCTKLLMGPTPPLTLT